VHITGIRVINQAKLLLKWDDNSEFSIPLNKLRKFCPCATCMTEREKQSKTYIPIFHSGQTKIIKISKVGNYAIGIHWEDGHNTGIYEFPFLKNLSEN
jgi:DUF971 family protein